MTPIALPKALSAPRLLIVAPLSMPPNSTVSVPPERMIAPLSVPPDFTVIVPPAAMASPVLMMALETI